MTDSYLGRAGSVLLVAMLLASSAAVGGVVAQSDNPTSTGTQTTATLVNEEYQTSWNDPTKYESDDGDVVAINGHVNQSADNAFAYTASDVEFDAAGQFPRVDGEEDNEASALDASEWTTSGASVSDTETAAGVEAVTVSANSAGDTATYSNWTSELDADPNKRMLQLVGDVTALGSSTVITVELSDNDGDLKQATFNASADASDEDVIATSTGEGFIYQRQVGEMTTVANGDGSFDDIDSITVSFSGGSSGAVDFSAINVEKMGTWDFGEKKVDNDDDDELETETIEERSASGQVMVHDLGTLGSAVAAENTTIHDLEVDVILADEDRSDEIEAEFNRTPDRPGYYGTANLYIPTGLASAYDISWSNAETEVDQEFLADRFLVVEYAEAIGDTDVEDVNSWTDLSGSVASQGETFSVDNTVQPGQENRLHIKLKLIQGEFEALQQIDDADTGGAAMGPGGGGGGLGNLPLIGGGVAFVLGLIGKARNWFPAWVPLFGAAG